jgi:5'-nucleotidase
MAEPSANPSAYNLNILHSNDNHANYSGFDQKNKICHQSICPGGSGGSLRLQRIIKALKNQYPDALLLNAGDEFQGTLFWRVHSWLPTFLVLNALGYQFFVPGNHEFDSGVATFQAFADQIKAQVISANLSVKNAKLRPKNLAPHAIIEVKGRKIGLVGLTTSDQNIYGDLVGNQKNQPFELINEKKALTASIQKLSAQGVDIIVALTHIGLDQDIKLAAEVEGLDIIVGGHSHTLLGELPNSKGPYPTVVKSPTGQSVLVVTGGSHGRYLGFLQTEFNEKGQPIHWSGGPWPITDQTIATLKAPPESLTTRVFLDALSLSIQNLLSQKVGQINVPGSDKVLEPTAYTCRQQECRSGDLVASALLDSHPQAQIALVNAGSIRAPLPVGDVSLGDILASLPYENFAAETKISGQELLEVLNYSVQKDKGHSGKFLQIAGLQVIFQTSAQREARVKEANVWNGKAWKPINPKTKYNLVSVDFLAHGGDGYEIFPKLKWKISPQLASDILTLYLKKEPINADYQPRISFILE